MAQLPHSALIAAAAKRHFTPLGMKRVGRSRTWLDDQGWFVTVVEFQPSSWSLGSYLNVGAHLLWTDSGHLSFDVGNRVAGFVPYESDSQFAPEADRLAAEAVAQVLSIRKRLRAPCDVPRELGSTPAGVGHPAYHRGIALALNGEQSAATRELALLAKMDDRGIAWARALADKAGEMILLASDAQAFRQEVLELIAHQRSVLKLPPVELSL